MTFDAKERSVSDSIPVEFYKFVRVLGDVTETWRYVNAPTNRTYDGAEYLALAGLQRSAVGSNGEDGSMQMELSVPRTSALAVALRNSVNPAPISVTVYRTQKGEDDAEAKTIFLGEIDNLVYLGGTLTILCFAEEAAWANTLVRVGYQRTCPHVLYDQFCGASMVEDVAELSVIADDRRSVEAAPSGPPTLTRSRLGRIYAYHASPTAGVNTAFVASDWTGYSTTGTCTPSLSGGALLLTVNLGSGSRGAYHNVFSQGNAAIKALRSGQTTGGAPGVRLRLKPSTFSDDFVNAGMPCGFAGNYSLGERSGGVSIQSQTSAANRSTSGTARFYLTTDGTLTKSRMTSASGSSGSSDITQTLVDPLDAGTDGSSASLDASSSSSNAFTYTSASITHTHLLRIEGPNTGSWVVRLRNAAGTLIYTSAGHTAGVVEIDCMTELLTLFTDMATPAMCQIEIYDPVGAAVVVGPEIPSERVWDGDVWEWDFPGVSLDEKYRAGVLVHEGIRYFIVRQSFNTLYLQTPLPATAAVEDEITLIAGCNRTMADCHSLHNNLPRFGGFPIMPERDPWIRVP
jgi:hypothetical protein